MKPVRSKPGNGGGTGSAVMRASIRQPSPLSTRGPVGGVSACDTTAGASSLASPPRLYSGSTRRPSPTGGYEHDADQAQPSPHHARLHLPLLREGRAADAHRGVHALRGAHLARRAGADARGPPPPAPPLSTEGGLSAVHAHASNLGG